MRKLRRALAWRLPPSEVHGVMADYEGFFASGKEEGKTEAELCQQFGPPRQVASALLREEGWRGSQMGLLLFVWTALTALLTWWQAFWRSGMSAGVGLSVLYFLQTALFPVLWRLWRDTLTEKPGPSSRRWTLAFYGIPTAVWVLVYGFVIYLFGVYLSWWQSLPPERQGTSYIGTILGWCYDLSWIGLSLLVLVILLRCWWEGTLRYLPAAAWTLGVSASLTRQCLFFTHMDITINDLELMKTLTLVIPLIPLGIVGLGGTLLTALLVWKGGRHGHAA